MIVLVSGATTYPRDAQIGHLIVPRQWNDPATLDLSQPKAMDNGCFTGLDAGAFVRMLEAYQPYQGSRWLFVTVPDVVGDAASTRRLWPFWSRLVGGLGWPLAFVAQDGITSAQVPWDEIAALFLGGSTAFKESAAARSLCAYAQARGTWVHWGRVNGKRRYELARKAGADSIERDRLFDVSRDTDSDGRRVGDGDSSAAGVGVVTCPHCGGHVKTAIERLRASRIRRGLCLDCPQRTEGPQQRCATCRDRKNRKRRKGVLGV